MQRAESLKIKKNGLEGEHQEPDQYRSDRGAAPNAGTREGLGVGKRSYI
jgi:hypothetical protein